MTDANPGDKGMRDVKDVALSHVSRWPIPDLIERTGRRTARAGRMPLRASGAEARNEILQHCRRDKQRTTSLGPYMT